MTGVLSKCRYLMSAVKKCLLIARYCYGNLNPAVQPQAWEHFVSENSLHAVQCAISRWGTGTVFRTRRRFTTSEVKINRRNILFPLRSCLPKSHYNKFMGSVNFFLCIANQTQVPELWFYLEHQNEQCCGAGSGSTRIQD